MVQWSWRGVSYEFDTCVRSLGACESDTQAVTLGQLLRVSRRVGGRRMTAQVRPTGSAVANVDAATVRAWARARGIAVPSRGRIPGPVRDAYLAHHHRR
jgi:hypothetical protein